MAAGLRLVVLVNKSRRAGDADLDIVSEGLEPKRPEQPVCSNSSGRMRPERTPREAFEQAVERLRLSHVARLFKAVPAALRRQALGLQDKARRVQHPGAHGSTKWWVDEQGNIRYDPPPHGEARGAALSEEEKKRFSRLLIPHSQEQARFIEELFGKEGRELIEEAIRIKQEADKRGANFLKLLPPDVLEKLGAMQRHYRQAINEHPHAKRRAIAEHEALVAKLRAEIAEKQEQKRQAEAGREQKRKEAAATVDISGLAKKSEVTPEDAHLAVIALLRAGALKEATRGKHKGKIILDPRAANDLRYDPKADDDLRHAMEAVRFYGTNSLKPSDPTIAAAHGRVWHEDGDPTRPLRTRPKPGAPDLLKLGMLMTRAIEKVNEGKAGAAGLLKLAEQGKKVGREHVAATAQRMKELGARERELIAAKEQERLPNGEFIDHGTWQPPDVIKTPAHSKGIYPWQAGAMQWALKVNKGVIGLDTGMGKTSWSIMHFAEMKRLGRADVGVIFAEVSQLGGWEEEIKQWYPSAKVVTVHGTKAQQEQALARAERGKPEFVLMSYGPLATENTKLLDRVHALGRPCYYFDEAKALRNHKAKTYKTAKRYVQSETTAAAFPLTATPTPNRPQEAWALVDLLQPGSLGTLRNFTSRYEARRAKGGRNVSVYQNLDKLHKRLEPYAYVKNRFDPDARKVLPELFKVPVRLTMEEDQAEHYRAARDGTLQALVAVDNPESLTIKETGGILGAITRMRQAAFTPATYDPNYRGSSAVVKAAVMHAGNFLEREPDKSIIMFAEHVSAFPKIRKELISKLGVKPEEVGMLTGQMAKEERDKVRQDLNSGKLKVALIGYKAGGQGLNLQKNANKVISLQPPWNPAIKKQAIDRAYRPGQKSAVTALDFSVPGTITDYMEQVLERKRGMAEAVWGSKESPEIVHRAFDYMDYVRMSGIPLDEVNRARRAAGKKEIKPPPQGSKQKSIRLVLLRTRGAFKELG